MLQPILMCYAWGPLIFDEFGRVTATERAVLEQMGEAVATAQGAAMTFAGMNRLFQLRSPSELTLPTKANRSRGEVVPFSYGPSLSTVYRCYDTFYHDQNALPFVEALTMARWHEALDFAFRQRGFGTDAAWETTGHYTRFENTLAGIAAGIGFIFYAGLDHPLTKLPPDHLEMIAQGNFSPLRAMANQLKIGIGWLLAAYVALYRRGDASKAAREALRGGGTPEAAMKPLHDLLWSVIPGYESSELFEFYWKLLLGMEIAPPKPGPKPKREKPAIVARPKGAPPAEESPAAAQAPANPLSRRSPSANLLAQLDGSALTSLAEDAARTPDTHP